MLHALVVIANDPLVRQAGTRVADALTDLLIEQGLGKGARAIGRFFKQRFEHSDNNEVVKGLERLSPFVTDITNGTRRLRDEGRLTPAQLDAQFDKPEVVAMLHSAFDTTVETDDTLRQKTLAELVLERLQAPDESLLAIATRTAIVAMRDLNEAHLRALALIELFQIQPSEGAILTQEKYEAYLERFVAPLLDVPVSEMTIRHLASLGLLDYDATGIRWENLGTPPILTATVTHYANAIGKPVPMAIMRRAHGDAKTGERALQELRVTPAGVVIALTVIKELVGLEVSLENFE